MWPNVNTYLLCSMQVCSIKWNTCTVNINIKKLLWKRKRNKRDRRGKSLLDYRKLFFPSFFPCFLSFSFSIFCCWPSFPSESLLHNLFPPLSLVWPSVWPSLPPFSLWAFNSSSAVKYFQPRICAGEQRNGSRNWARPAFPRPGSLCYPSPLSLIFHLFPFISAANRPMH